MRIKTAKPFLAIAFLLLCGFAAGTVNGLFGTGGGIIAVFALANVPFFKNLLSPKEIFATTLCAAFIMSLSSVFIYARASGADFSAAIPHLPPALAGGYVGALLLDKVKTGALKKIFALLVLYAGAMLIWR